MIDTASATVIVGIFSFTGTLVGAYFSNRKSAALMSYRLDQLEEKVDRHNQVIERTYELEKQTAVLEDKIKSAQHRIDDLEAR